MNGSTGWRTLAAPTFGVIEHGTAVRLEAGTLLQPYNAKGVDPGTGCGVKRGPEGTSTFLFRDAEGWDETNLAYLSASALRFEGDEGGTGVPERFVATADAGPIAFRQVVVDKGSCDFCGKEFGGAGWHRSDGAHGDTLICDLCAEPAEPGRASIEPDPAPAETHCACGQPDCTLWYADSLVAAGSDDGRYSLMGREGL